MAELSREEMERYSRHLVLPEVSLSGQRQLKNARVLCVGAGGLGSPVTLYLAAAGIGTLGLVEFDDGRPQQYPAPGALCHRRCRATETRCRL